MSDFVDTNRLAAERFQLLEKRSELLTRADALAELGDSMSSDQVATLAGLVTEIRNLDNRLTGVEQKLNMDSQAEQASRSAFFTEIELRAGPSLAKHKADLVGVSRAGMMPRHETRSQSGLMGAWLRLGTDVEKDGDSQLLHRHGLRSAKELELRSSILTSASPGSNLIGKSYMPKVIEELKQFCTWFDFCTVIDTPKGNELRLPVDQDSNGANAVGALITEGTAETEKNIALSEISMNAYVASSGLVTVSLETLADAEVDVENLINNILTRRLGRRLDAWFSLGSGSSAPKGVFHSVGSGTGSIPSGNVVTAASASAIALDELQSVIAALDPEYIKSPKLRWMMSLGTLTALRKIKASGTGEYILTDAIDGPAPTIFGIPVVIQPNAPSIAAGNASVVLGDFSNFYIRRVMDFRLVKSEERYFEQRLVAFMGICRFDSRLANPLAFAALKHP